MKSPFVTLAIAWLATALVACTAIMVSHHPGWGLLLLIPASFRASHSDDKESKDATNN